MTTSKALGNAFKLRDEVNVKDPAFGTTAAIQAAITEAGVSAGGNKVTAPAGVYSLTTGLVNANGKKITFEGAGYRHTTLDWKGANNSTILKYAGTGDQHDLNASDLEFKSSTAATGIVGIQVGETAGNNLISHVNFSNMLFNGIATAIAVYDQCNNINLDNHWFFDLTGTVVDIAAPGTTSTGGCIISRSHFMGGTTAQTCVEVDEISLLVVTENVLEANSVNFKGLIIDKADAVNITGNYWENQSGVGPFVHYGTTAIGSDAMSGGIISGNHIDSNHVALSVGIKLDFCKGVVVTGNTFRATETGIHITVNATSWEVGPQAWGNTVVTKLLIDSTDKHGNITDPETRPRFHAKNAAVANVTGLSGAYTIIYGTESYDIGSGYNNATGVFVAPYPGVYHFNASAFFSGVTAAMTIGQFGLRHDTAADVNISNYVGWGGSPAAIRDFNDEVGFSGSWDVPMLAGEKAYVRIYVTRGAGDTMDLDAGGVFSCNRL